jgi:hypothetical protein
MGRLTEKHSPQAGRNLMKKIDARLKLEALRELAIRQKKIRDRKSGEKVTKIAAKRLPKSDSPDERSLAGSVLSQAAS